jgi:site-specific DNA recombinase
MTRAGLTDAALRRPVYVRCGLCDQRMFGKTRHGRAYYCCHPATNNADRLDRYPADHPKAIYVREDVLVEALDHVIAARIFGPDRLALIRVGLAALPAKQHDADARRAQALRDEIDDLTSRQDRLIPELEITDPADRAFRDRLRRRFDTLEAVRSDKISQLDELEMATSTEPYQDESLLDTLPILGHVDITKAPERIQRKLYDAFQLQIHYERPDQARFRLVLTDDNIEAFTERSTAEPVPIVT